MHNWRAKHTVTMRGTDKKGVTRFSDRMGELGLQVRQMS